MPANNIDISRYNSSDHSEVLQLLVELHSTYFTENASPQIRELQSEHNLETSYGKYLDKIENCDDGSWLIVTAKSEAAKVVAFVIGSLRTDESMVFGKIGKFEDMFVNAEFRGQGIGIKLYNELENWFLENGCQQVQSDTWQGNEFSISAHQQLGFFISGVSFSKKL